MKIESVGKNYLYNVCYQLVIAVIPLVITPYTSRVLGADGIGQYSYTYSIVTYFMLFSVLGTTNYGQREIASKRDNVEVRSETFFNILSLRAITTSISVISCTIFAYCYNIMFQLMMIQCLNIIAVFFDISWFYQGIEEFKKIILRNIVFKTASVIFIFLFIKNKEDLYLYALGLAIFNILGNLSLWRYLPYYIEKISLRKINPFDDIKQIMQLFIPTIAMQVYLVLDKTMIGIFSDSSIENGYYEQAEKIVKMLLMLVTSMGTVMLPRISYIYEKGDMIEVRKKIYSSYRFVFFIGVPMCMGLGSIADKVVPWFLGSEFEKCNILIRILCILIPVIGISNVTGMQYLVPVKKQNVLTCSVMLGALTNLLLNIYLIPKLYSIGAAIASVLAEIVVTVVQIFYLIKFEEISFGHLVKNSKNYLVAGTIMFMIIFHIKYLFSATIKGCIGLTSIGIGIYFLVLLLVKDEFLYHIIGFFKKINMN